MVTAARVEISEFDASQAPAVPPQIDRHSARNWSALIGVVGTLCLHAIVLQSLGFGVGTQNQRSSEPWGAFANQARSLVVPAEELVLITLQDAPGQRSDLAQQIRSLAPKLKPTPIAILSPDPLPISDLIGAPDAPVDGTKQEPLDPATRAMMLERYLGQISARVERVWAQSRERSSEEVSVEGDKETFRCRVQIRQDASGNVEEVLLLECPGEKERGQSLVAAIFQASPLNAPPIPSVFSRALTMTFEAPRANLRARDFKSTTTQVPAALQDSLR